MPSDPGNRLSPDTYIPHLPVDSAKVTDTFIVCGLGSLGQQTIVNLKRFSIAPFEVQITAIEPEFGLSLGSQSPI